MTRFANSSERIHIIDIDRETSSGSSQEIAVRESVHL